MATYRRSQLGFLRVEVSGKKEASCLGLAMVKFPILKLAVFNCSPSSLAYRIPKDDLVGGQPFFVTRLSYSDMWKSWEWKNQKSF